MRKIGLMLLVSALTLSALAGMPQPKTLKLAWDQYSIAVGGSNAVITVYKATSLGTVYTPFKPTAIVPATRTNVTLTLLPGTYKFYTTATVQPFGESDPSNTITNKVNP